MKDRGIKTWKDLTTGIQHCVLTIILSSPDLSFSLLTKKFTNQMQEVRSQRIFHLFGENCLNVNFGSKEHKSLQNFKLNAQKLLKNSFN